MQVQAPAIIPSSGAWPAKTWTMAIWMGAPLQNLNNGVNSMMNRLKTYSLLPLVVAAMACGGGEATKSIVVTNQLDIASHELVAVPYGAFTRSEERRVGE